MRQRRRRYLRYVLHAAVLGGLVLATVRYLSGEEVFEALRTFHYIHAPFILGLSAGYLLLKGWRFVLWMRPLTDLRWHILFRGYVAGQAATILPGGIAARYGLMSQVGVPVGKSSPAILFSSTIDQAVFIAGSLIAAFWFEAARLPAAIMAITLALLAFVAIIPLTRRWLSAAAEWMAKKLNIGDQWQDFLNALPQVAAPRVMISTLIITLVALGFIIVALDLCLRGVGVSLPYPTLILAHILPSFLGRLFPLPAGIGVTEVSMVGFLAATAAITPETAAVAVAIFRVTTVLFQAMLGALVYLFGWRGEREKVGPYASNANLQSERR